VPVPGTWISMCGRYALYPIVHGKMRHAYLAKNIIPDEQNFVEFGIHKVLLKGKAGDERCFKLLHSNVYKDLH
jgi:hypothetical protein